jgi:hypothetical protein
MLHGVGRLLIETVNLRHVSTGIVLELSQSSMAGGFRFCGAQKARPVETAGGQGEGVGEGKRGGEGKEGEKGEAGRNESKTRPESRAVTRPGSRAVYGSQGGGGAKRADQGREGAGGDTDEMVKGMDTKAKGVPGVIYVYADVRMEEEAEGFLCNKAYHALSAHEGTLPIVSDSLLLASEPVGCPPSPDEDWWGKYVPDEMWKAGDGDGEVWWTCCLLFPSWCVGHGVSLIPHGVRQRRWTSIYRVSLSTCKDTIS